MNELEVKNGYINGQKITGGVIPLEKFNDFFHDRNVSIDYYCMDLYGTVDGKIDKIDICGKLTIYMGCFKITLNGPVNIVLLDKAAHIEYDIIDFDDSKQNLLVIKRNRPEVK
jgi:hypothetical protein